MAHLRRPIAPARPGEVEAAGLPIRPFAPIASLHCAFQRVQPRVLVEVTGFPRCDAMRCDAMRCDAAAVLVQSSRPTKSIQSTRQWTDRDGCGCSSTGPERCGARVRSGVDAGSWSRWRATSWHRRTSCWRREAHGRASTRHDCVCCADGANCEGVGIGICLGVAPSCPCRMFVRARTCLCTLASPLSRRPMPASGTLPAWNVSRGLMTLPTRR